jgi:hypothetical protein
MKCYRDMEFCPFWKDCEKSVSCRRPLTETIREAANGFGLPICKFTETPDCWEEIEGSEGSNACTN